jgi:hypothetical protein
MTRGFRLEVGEEERKFSRCHGIAEREDREPGGGGLETERRERIFVEECGTVESPCLGISKAGGEPSVV